MAGPWSTQILADLGADVIKIERSGQGDDTRKWGPPYLKDTDGNPTQESGYYLSVNRGKRSVEIDLTSEDGQATVRALARKADIVVENFKVDTLVRYGLDATALREINPRLIYCSITGFGNTGPRRKQAAYDFMIQAMGGLMSVTGERDGEPGAGPQKIGVPIVDIMTGMYASVAVLAALARRNETGKGDTIDIAMLDVQTAFLANQAMNYLVSGKTPVRNGNKHPNIQPQDVFQCRDGHIVIAVGNDAQFEKFCSVLGMDDWAQSPDFATNAARVTNLAKLHGEISRRLGQYDLEHWITALGTQGVPCGPINTIPMVFEDSQVKHRGMLRQLKHPLADTVPQVVSPMRFEDAALTFENAPPLLGQHTQEVMAELKLDADGREKSEA